MLKFIKNLLLQLNKKPPALIPDDITAPRRFYFMSSNDFSKSTLQAAVQKYGHILVGFDPGNKDVPDDDALNVIKNAQAVGASLHVYFVGPTMQSWSAEERKQCEYLAESVGINTDKKDWQKEWYSTGWERKIQQQFRYYWTKYKAYSLEIDNLDSCTMKYDWDQYVDFFQRLDKFRKANDIETKLMLKNIDDDGMDAIEKAVKDNRLDGSMFAPWALFEAETGSEKHQYGVAARLGIRAVTPSSGLRETHTYGVSSDGVPGLDDTTNPWVGRDETYK